MQPTRRGASPTGSALLVAGVYAVVAAGWIAGSDRLVAWLAADLAGATALQTYKGWAFVGVTASLLFATLVGAFRRVSASEADYGALFQQHGIGKVMIAANQTVLRINDEACRLLGLTAADVEGRQTFLELVHPEDRARMSEYHWDRRQTGAQAPVVYACRLCGANRETIDVVASVTLLPDHERSVVALIDVREQRRLERQVIQAQKMEAIGRLAGGIAHDFNNVLTTIKGYAGMLEHELDADDPRREDAHEISRAADRARELTTRILGFSRHPNVETGSAELDAALRALVPVLQRTLGGDVDVRLVAEAPGAVVGLDRTRIEQVVLNMAINARDAMPDGGRLVLETAVAELDEADVVRLPGLKPGRYVRLAISDTGTGMDAGTQARIFEPFFTTKDEEKGTGLGLASAYGLVEQARGRITVYSEVGHGTTFRVLLPVVSGAAAAAQAAGVAGLGTIEGGETVLLVEDDRQLRQLSERVLSRLGYRIWATASLAEARARVAADGLPEAVVCDVVLGDGTGPALVAELRAQAPTLPVLFVSGYAEHAALPDRAELRHAGFLEKPYSASELGRRLRALLDEGGAA